MRRVGSAVSSLACVAAAVVLVGCAGRKPVANIAKAELAVDHAVESNAVAHAPTELELAQEKLYLARRAMDRGENAEARRLADEALVHAQLAEAKAKSDEARLAAGETVRSIETMRSTVVVEKPASTVVVERSNAPDLVIEREPKTVVIEQHPKTVFVEPEPKTVVIEREPATVTVERKPAAAVVVEPNPSVIITR